MNILYLLFSFTTGGTERLVADICNEMVKRDQNVHLYIVNDLYSQGMLDALSPRVQVCLQKRPAGGGGKLQTLWSVAKYMRKHKIRAVHCNSLDAPQLLLLKPFLAPRTKVLFTVHGMHQIVSKPSWYIRLCNLLCHQVIGISQCVREDILKAGIRPEKVAVVPNAIDLSKFPTPSNKAFVPQLPVVGNVARIQPEVKGQDILIRAMGILKQTYPNIRCIIGGAPGKGQEAQLEQLKQLTSELELTQNITFAGMVEDIPGFLSQIDIFALPSRSEGFGIALVEAMAMGVPCVASALEGPEEVLQGGEKGLLFAPEDPEDLARKLQKMLSDLEQYKAAAKSHIAYVQKEYAIGVMCDRLQALMEQK